MVLWDNSDRGVKEEGWALAEGGLLSQCTDSSGAGMALYHSPRITVHWMHAVPGEKAYFWIRQVSLAKGNLQGRR